MAEHTGISWTDHTFNVAWGCTEVSPGCDNCYARTWAAKMGHLVWGADAPRRLFGDAHWNDPIRWDRAAEKAGERRRVFCSSMADVFDAHPDVVGQLPRLWALVRATPWLDWQLLTKRHARITRSLPPDWGDGYPNVWLGVSAESREWWDRRVPALVAIPAAVHWVSAEPLLGDLALQLHDFVGLDWVVFGGESGQQRRECDRRWIPDGCSVALAAGCAVYVKQDSHRQPGQQGRLSANAWSLKQFPTTRPALAA